MVASVNKNTCRITIACANPASVIEPTTCGDLIGIGRGTDNELLIPLAANLNPAYTIAFPRGFNFGGTPYAFLKCRQSILTISTATERLMIAYAVSPSTHHKADFVIIDRVTL
jgi:hypothetical protein